MRQFGANEDQSTMTTQTVTDSRQRFFPAPARIALNHRLLPAMEQNVAHNNVRRQENLSTQGGCFMLTILYCLLLTCIGP